MDLIIRQFNALHWHDSKLLGLSFFSTDAGEQVKISLLLHEEGEKFTPIEMMFIDSVYIEADVYLEAKRACANDVSEAECCASSAWKGDLANRFPYDNFEGYLHFGIDLIAPGGTINILAKNFSVEPATL